MKTKWILLVWFVVFQYGLNAQELTQVIRGNVVDEVTGLPIVGANVVLLNQEVLKGTTTDADGNFRIDEVPIGRQGIKVSFMGYKPALRNNLLVISGKEMILNIKLQETFQDVGEIFSADHIFI